MSASPAENGVERGFSDSGVSALFALPEDERLAGCYRSWMRKAAHIKAVGIRLGHKSHLFAIPSGYEAAVATHGLIHALIVRDLPTP